MDRDGSPDPTSSEIVRLFNPRLDSWDDHFGWSSAALGQFIARTAIGRATLELLRINDPDMIALRIVLAELGLFVETVS